MFCVHHPIPHEDCPHCLATIAAMRPTVFAELAAAELRSGIECCTSCDHVYDEAVAEAVAEAVDKCHKCPQCGAPHPSTAPDFPARPVADLGDLTFRDLAGASGRSGTPAAGSRAMR